MAPNTRTNGTSGTSPKTDPEDVIRRYLVFLSDPASLRDEKDIEKKTVAVMKADDPIEKLKALAALTAASVVDETPLREGFVAYAKTWAEAEGIPVKAFVEMKVPADVLTEAGFTVNATAKRGGTSGASRQRAQSVPVEDIKAHVLTRTGVFIQTDVINGFGGSPATVRKAVDELIAEGKVEKLGTDPDHSGRGRAPIQYKVKSTNRATTAKERLSGSAKLSK